MLRMLRPDLLCGLCGFMLGAAALLATHEAAARAPAPTPAHIDILTLAASTARPAEAG